MKDQYPFNNFQVSYLSNTDPPTSLYVSVFFEKLFLDALFYIFIDYTNDMFTETVNVNVCVSLPLALAAYIPLV